MNKWDKLLEEFIGKDKVESNSIFQNDDDNWIYKFKEKGIRGWQEITLPDRETAENFHFMFGGKNASTVSAPEKLNTINDWGADYIEYLGHRITEISVQGLRCLRSQTIPIDIPEGCGHQKIIGKKKKEPKKDIINLRQNDVEKCDFTRVFKGKDELNQFVYFLKNDPLLKNLKFYVRKMTTENEETYDVGLWKRCSAKDGTARMIVELKKINGLDYTKLMYRELLAFADGMADAECKKIPQKPTIPKPTTICYFAAKNGKFD